MPTRFPLLSPILLAQPDKGRTPDPAPSEMDATFSPRQDAAPAKSPSGALPKIIVAAGILAVALLLLLWLSRLMAPAPHYSASGAQSPPLIHTLREAVEMDSLEFCGEPVPLHRQDVREKLEKELMLMVWNRPQVILWIKRSARYFPHMEEVFARRGMPDDLKYVSIIESALRPHAASGAKAVGFWQFIRPTARKYNLAVNKKIDERRNLFTSTRAAADYYQDLYAQFGSWALAAAAYNMGEAGLAREMELQEQNNYYDLHLFLETQRYVFRILAAKLILENPEKYGFFLEEQDLYPPLEFDLVQVRAIRDMPVIMAARAADTTYREIKYLNPQLRNRAIPAGEWEILVPKGAGKDFNLRFDALWKAWLESVEGKTYVVQKGDTLTAIAQKHGVDMGSLLEWNDLSLKNPIHPGDELIVYQKKEKQAGVMD